MLKEGLGFEYLLPQEQQAYKVIMKAFSSMAVSFNCSQINCSIDLMKIIHTVLGDNPSIIYFNKTQIETEQSLFGKTVFLTGIHSKSQIEKMNMALEVKTNQIITPLKSTSNDEYSLLINLYHYLQKNIQYDKEELQANSKGISKNHASHNAYGALINGIAVCDGFSSAFALLAKKLGFECMLVVGHSAYSSSSFTNHAWNIIKIHDKFYHMDITWDAKKYIEFGEYSYAYFALKDEEIKYDHKWDKKTAPICKYNDFSYYIKNRLYVTNTDRLREIIKSNNQKHGNIYRLKLSCDVLLPNNAREYLAEIIINKAMKSGKQTQLSYSWNENTRCFFAKAMN